MDEERDVEQTSEDEEVEAHHRRAPQEPGVRARQEDDEDEVEAHRMFQSPEEPEKRF